MPSFGTWRPETGRVLRQGASTRNIPAGLPGYRVSSTLARDEDRVNHLNWPLWLIPLVLSGLGVVMIASLTARSSPREGLFYGLALKQCLFLGMGFLLMCACYLTPLSFIRRVSCFVWLMSVLMAWGTLIPGIGVRAGGASRWLNLGFMPFQPLEILTLAVPLFLADRLAVSKREGIQAFFRPSLVMAFFSALPIFFQPNKGGTFLVLAICMSMHIENRGWKYPILGALPLGGLFFANTFLVPYSMRRWLAFLDPWADPLGKGYQIIQGLVAFSNGGAGGVGLGRGLQNQFLPAAHTDYIFSAMGEEFGLMGTLLVVFLYAAWTLGAYLLYRRARDPYISVLTWGLTASIIFPMFLNLGGVMKLMPLTGIPLPFLSAGGSAMAFMWLKVGVLMRAGRELALSDRERYGIAFNVKREYNVLRKH
jgi:cell division protein FtsW